MALTLFNVKGPFTVPLYEGVDSKMVTEDLSQFWAHCESIKPLVGCYVFAIRAGKGFTPLYVGKTTNSFEKECFTDHKIKHYNYGLASYKKGTPVMFFIAYPAKKGKTNAADVKDLEDFLIQVGRRINPDLRNIKGVKQPSWGIKGVIRGGKGKATTSETALRRVFGL